MSEEVFTTMMKELQNVHKLHNGHKVQDKYGPIRIKLRMVEFFKEGDGAGKRRVFLLEKLYHS